MVDYYVFNVEHGYKKWTKVNKLWQEDVKKKLVEDGYILNEDGTVTKYEPDTDNSLSNNSIL